MEEKDRRCVVCDKPCGGEETGKKNRDEDEKEPLGGCGGGNKGEGKTTALVIWHRTICSTTTPGIKMMKRNAKAPSWFNQLVH